MKPLASSFKASLEKAVAEYEKHIEDAREYLTARGILHGPAEAFRLGVVRDPLLAHEQYAGRLAIPSLGVDGAPVSLRFRCMEEHSCKDAGHGKYLGLPGADLRLFNPRAFHRAGDSICITEGEIDAISLEIAGLPAVGVTGAQAWRRYHPRCFAGFSTVYVMEDGDSAGAEFVKTVIASLPNGGVPVRMGEGCKDANEYLVKHGAEALRAHIEESDK